MSDETTEPERRSSPVWAVAKGMGTVFKQTFRRDNTEYGGGRFAAYFAAEYLNVLVVSGLTVTLFLGGWNIPFVDPPTWVDPIVVLVKMIVFSCFFIWVRATLPRLRYDQLMAFGWKILLPLATLNALVTAIIVVVTD